MRTLTLLTSLAACGSTSLLEGPVPSFALTDVNPESATADAAVSPDDFAGGASAWYFGHAT